MGSTQSAVPGGFSDLRVYQLAYKLAMQIFKETKALPHDQGIDERLMS